MKLTKRGERVRNVFIAVLLLAVFVVAENLATPDRCKVDTVELSQSCKDLLYP
jgi:hypothetical protein